MDESLDAHPHPNSLDRSQLSNNWRNRHGIPNPDPLIRRQTQRPSQQEGRHDDRYEEIVASKKLDSRVYVGNLLYTVQREDVAALFASNGFKVQGMSMSIDPFTGRNPSYAFVDLSSGDEANEAIQTLNGRELFGRPVRVNAGVRKTSPGDRFEGRVKNWQQDWGKKQERSLGMPLSLSPCLLCTFEKVLTANLPS